MSAFQHDHPPWLSRTEIAELTGLKQFAAQVRALQTMQPPIPFRIRPNRSIIIFRADLHTSSGTLTPATLTRAGTPATPPANGMNWSKAA